jgi:hypothetical protein
MKIIIIFYKIETLLFYYQSYNFFSMSMLPSRRRAESTLY